MEKQFMGRATRLWPEASPLLFQIGTYLPISHVLATSAPFHPLSHGRNYIEKHGELPSSREQLFTPKDETSITARGMC